MHPHSLTHLLFLFGAAATAQAELITVVPGPDDQGGMLMPMVTIQATAGTGTSPTAGVVHVNFTPAAPLLQSLQAWSPGAWFDETAAWRSDLGSPAGQGGTPLANAGTGDLFNNQFGFMSMRMGTMMMANLPADSSLAIRLVSVSSPLLQSYNYSAGANRWDEVFANVGDQVLWNGTMWHNYFTVPADAPAGTYLAEFSVFLASTPFTGSTGFAQYDETAQLAVANPAFTPATITYTWTVAAIPEPASAVLGIGLGALTCAGIRRHRRRVIQT